MVYVDVSPDIFGAFLVYKYLFMKCKGETMDDKKYYEIFTGKTLSDVFKDIYDNSTTTRDQLHNLLKELKPYIKSLNDAAILIPVMKEILEIGVKNDEMKVKLATEVVKLVRQDRIKNGEPLTLISEDEKEQLTKEVENYDEYQKRETEKLAAVRNRVDHIKEKVMENRKEKVKVKEEKVVESRKEKIKEEK